MDSETDMDSVMTSDTDTSSDTHRVRVAEVEEDG